MRILTRRIGETLCFELPMGDRIAGAVLDNSRSQVRVGIEAPAEVNVVREEVRLREAGVEEGWQRTQKRRLSDEGWRRPIQDSPHFVLQSGLSLDVIAPGQARRIL